MDEDSIFEVCPATVVVEVNQKKHKVHGIPIKVILELVGRFPGMGVMLTGGSISGESMLQFGGDAVHSLIAAGFKKWHDKEAETRASEWPLETQVDFLTGIIKATMPSGYGPFREKVVAAMAMVKVETVDEGAPATQSAAQPAPQPARDGRMRFKKDEAGEMVLVIPPKAKPSSSSSSEQSNSSAPEADNPTAKFGT